MLPLPPDSLTLESRVPGLGGENDTSAAIDTVNTTARPDFEFVCAADEDYALPLAVMLESLLANIDPKARSDVHIIDCGMSPLSRDGIDSLARGGARFHWRPSVLSEEFSTPAWGHVTGATYERLMMGHHLPADSRYVLWLDADLLVLDNVTPIFLDRPANSVLSAVRDPFVPRVSSPFGVRDWRTLGLAYDTPYFNAGVMRIDMKKWRELQVAEQALEYLRVYGRSVHFNEQEALNAVVGPDWTSLDDRWNVSANPFHARRQRPGDGKAAIIHFAGRVKPWAVPDLGEIQDIYFQHLDSTPWCHVRPKRTVGTKLLSWYLASVFRRSTYWLENQHLRLRHFWGI